MIYYGPKQKGRRKTLMTAVSFSLRLADLKAEEKNVPTHTSIQTHTSSRTHTYIQNLYIHFYTQILMGKSTTVSSPIYIYMMRVCMCVYRKYIYKNTMTTFSYYATTALYCTAYIGTAACANRRKNNTVRTRGWC